MAWLAMFGCFGATILSVILIKAVVGLPFWSLLLVYCGLGAGLALLVTLGLWVTSLAHKQASRDHTPGSNIRTR